MASCNSEKKNNHQSLYASLLNIRTYYFYKERIVRSTTLRKSKFLSLVRSILPIIQIVSCLPTSLLVFQITRRRDRIFSVILNMIQAFL